MSQHDSGGPSPESFEPRADQNGRDISPDDGPTAVTHRDREVETRPDPDAPETDIPKADADAEEAIDRATASLGDDDGKR